MAETNNDNNSNVETNDRTDDFASAIMEELGGPSDGGTTEAVDDGEGAGEAQHGNGNNTRDEAGRFKKKATGDDNEQGENDGDDDDDQQVDADKRGYTRKLEEVNYTVRNLERRMNALIDRIDAQGGKPTKAQAEQLGEIKEEIEEIDLFKGREDFEELTVADARKLQAQLKAGSKTPSAVQRELDAMRAELNRQRQERDFIRQNPQLADQYDDIVAEAWKHADADFADTPDSDPMKVGAVKTYMKLIVKARNNRASSKKSTTTQDVVPARPSNKTDTSTKGAQAVTKGASRAGESSAPVDEDARFNDYANDIMNELGR